MRSDVAQYLADNRVLAKTPSTLRTCATEIAHMRDRVRAQTLVNEMRAAWNDFFKAAQAARYMATRVHRKFVRAGEAGTVTQAMVERA